MRVALVVLAALGALTLASCGGSDASGGTDRPSAPGTTNSPSGPAPTTPTTAPTAAAADVEQTCVDLYHPPGQLLLRAVGFVRGRVDGDPVAQAGDLVDALSTVADSADPTMAADIAVVRISVDTQRALVQSDAGTTQDLRSFNAAVRRLAAACASYGE